MTNETAVLFGPQPILFALLYYQPSQNPVIVFSLVLPARRWFFQSHGAGSSAAVDWPSFVS